MKGNNYLLKFVAKVIFIHLYKLKRVQMRLINILINKKKKLMK